MMTDIPKAPAEYLDVSFGSNEPNESRRDHDTIIQNNAMLPFAISSIYWARVISADKISCGNDVKNVYDLVLDMEGCGFDLISGDTIGICPKNEISEVEELMKRLGVESMFDAPCEVSVKSDTTKKNASVPSFIPRRSTLRHIFETCLDLHAVPKKLFIRALLEYTTDQNERQSLEELCARKSDQYTAWISSSKCCLAALLNDHPSCCPPISLLLEHLPRLQPRPYSIAHLTGDNGKDMHIAFSLVQYFSGGVQKCGVCTGWLEKITEPLRCPVDKESSLSSQMEKLRIQSDQNSTLKIPVFLRKSSGFHLPEDPTRPLIMIGPGVGVAPFIGFLQQRRKQIKEMAQKQDDIGECWLFYGCRYCSRDELYKEEVLKHLSELTLNEHHVSYSREPDSRKYVQDNIRHKSRDICRLLLDEEGYIYVCGDAHNMARDVLATIIDCIAKDRVMSKGDAQLRVMDLQARGHYKEDVWTVQDDVVRMYSKVMAEEKKRQAVLNAPPPQIRHQHLCDMV